jgi:hypothetical protein
MLYWRILCCRCCAEAVHVVWGESCLCCVGRYCTVRCYGGAVHAVLEESCSCSIGGKMFKLSKWKFSHFLLQDIFHAVFEHPFSRTTVHTELG